MSTSNFGRLQLCNKYWSFWLEEEDEFVFDDTRINVLSELKKKDYFWETIKDWYDKYRIVWYYNVEYYNKIGKYWDSNEYYIIIEYGYYDGARFDIIPNYDKWYNYIYINKTYEKKRKKIIEDIEKVFTNYCVPLVRVGSFYQNA